MNKTLCATVLALSISTVSIAQNKKIRTEEVISEGKGTVGYVVGKKCIDNEVGTYPVDQRFLYIDIFVEEQRYSFIEETNTSFYEKVKKGDLVNAIYLEKSDVSYKKNKVIDKRIKSVFLFGVGPRTSEPADSILVHKFIYKIF
jgi:hypothetical protein